jgi:hypothetical protein
MSSALNRQVQKALAATLKLHGFLKDGPTWRHPYPDTITVLNLQGSQWGPSFYLNLGVYFRALGTDDKPLEHRCHIRIRLCDVVPEQGRLRQLLDFEQPMADSVRFGELERLVASTAVPWLERVSTLKGAREYLLDPAPRMPLVSASARQLLDVPSGV